MKTRKTIPLRPPLDNELTSSEMSKSYVVRIVNALICTVCLCALALAADQKAPTKLSDLPPEAQRAISAALARKLPRIDDFTLTASDGLSGDYFGYSVAISGNTVVVGAPQTTINGNQKQGSAYVFVKPVNGWANMTQTAELTSSDGQPLDYFGNSVAINGRTVVVGSPRSVLNGNFSQGAAYVFVEPPNGWTNMTQTAKLSASDGAAYAFFGTAAATSGDAIVVGSPYSTDGNMLPGTAYVFVEPSGGWVDMTQTAELTASDGAPNDGFGFTVSIDSNTTIVGGGQCPSCTGSAYVFVEPPNGWVDTTQTAELTPSDSEPGENFGQTVSVSGDTIAVGDPIHGFEEAGAVYVFAEPAGGWVNMTQTAELTVRGAEFACVGNSVSIAGNVILAGADCTSLHTGAAYAFVKPAGGWQNSSKVALKLSIPFKYRSDYFGASVAISGNTGIVGAFYATSTGLQRPGEAFVFTEK